MFSHDFMKVPVEAIAAAIEQDGVYLHDSALDPSFVTEMMGQFGANRVAINHNGLSPVSYGRGWCLNQVLAQSQAAFDLAIHDKILDIGEKYLGAKTRL